MFREELAQLLYETVKGKVVGSRPADGDERGPSRVGYIIGPRISCVMVAGGVLAYLVIGPTIAYFGENLDKPLPPAVSHIEKDKDGNEVDSGLIRNMDESTLRKNYILYIGAGAVAAGGIISMFKALPVIAGAVSGGLRDLRGGSSINSGRRTERDLPMILVVVGSLILVILLAALPQLGLGPTLTGFAGAFMIVVFKFLFVTVSPG